MYSIRIDLRLNSKNANTVRKRIPENSCLEEEAFGKRFGVRPEKGDTI